jgi:hypothetical protein
MLALLDATIARTEGLLARRRVTFVLRAALGLDAARAKTLVRSARDRLASLHERRRGLLLLAGAGRGSRAASLGRRPVRRAA